MKVNQTDVAPAPASVVGSSSWTGGRIAEVVIGATLVLLALGLLGVGGAALWADRTQRDSGYVTSDVHAFSTGGSALVTVPTDLGSAWTGWLYAPALLDRVRIRITPTSPEREVFVGIGPTSDVDRYLAGTSRTEITDFWTEKAEPVDGGAVPSAPGSQRFWVASAAGRGEQNVVWNPADGSWRVVVMNADGGKGVAVEADLGAKLPALPWIAIGVLIAGGLALAAGTLLTIDAVRRGRRPDPAAAPS